MRNQPTPHDSAAPTLDLRDVSVRYGATTALDGVSFTVEPGAHVAVVGPNGAGKSTLFNLIAGTIAPTRGRVDIFGSQPQRHLCIGYVPQRSQIDTRFPVSVWDVVMMGRVGQIGFFRRARAVDREAVEAALRQVDMLNLRRRQIGELSGGQQQRVFLARALAQGAELLLLDEPLSGLDAPSQEAILALIAELRGQPITVLTATHDLNQAAAHFSHVLLLNRRLIAYGRPSDVLTAQNLSAAYGNHLHVLPSRDGSADGASLTVLADSCCDDGEHTHGRHEIVRQREVEKV